MESRVGDTNDVLDRVGDTSKSPFKGILKRFLLPRILAQCVGIHWILYVSV